MGKCETPFIVALDYPDADSAMTMARQLDPTACRLKVGKELYTRAGPAVIEQLQALGFELFLDLKFHDIPNTVAQACLAAAELNVWMVNVHASGGRRMMEAAANALQGARKQPLLLAVTVLTSLEAADLREIGITQSPEQQVALLATLTKDCGLDGVVCSAHEVGGLRNLLGEPFIYLTPGIRLSTAKIAAHDQRRIMTPSLALDSGSSFLVIGRPITTAEKPHKVLASLVAMWQSR